jgi:hypothetical protein
MAGQTLKYRELPGSIPCPETPDTKDLEALLASLNGSPERFQIVGHGVQPG